MLEKKTKESLVKRPPRILRIMLDAGVMRESLITSGFRRRNSKSGHVGVIQGSWSKFTRRGPVSFEIKSVVAGLKTLEVIPLGLSIGS